VYGVCLVCVWCVYGVCVSGVSMVCVVCVWCVRVWCVYGVYGVYGVCVVCVFVWCVYGVYGVCMVCMVCMVCVCVFSSALVYPQSGYLNQISFIYSNIIQYQWMLKKLDWKKWIGFIWLRIRTSGRLL